MDIEWTNNLIMEFIQLYESYPVLWNPKHKNHKNRNALCDAWECIAKEISANVSVDALRKKKESLMSTYRTLAKKVRDSSTTGSGAVDVYEPTWFAFKAIDRFISANSSKIPSLSSEENQNDSVSLQDDEGNEVVESNDDPELKQDKGFVSPQGAPRKRGRGGLSQTEMNITKHLKHASDMLTNIANKSQTHHPEPLQDEPAIYGQLLAVKLRRLSRRTQLVLQNKIDNLVFEAELEDLDSSTCNTTNPTEVLTYYTTSDNIDIINE